MNNKVLIRRDYLKMKLRFIDAFKVSFASNKISYKGCCIFTLFFDPKLIECPALKHKFYFKYIHLNLLRYILNMMHQVRNSAAKIE